MHWKLDEANDDYTAGGYTEEVSGSTLSAEVVSGTDVTEGSPGLAPDSGSSVSFSINDPDTFINAGSLESDGTHVAGVVSSPFVLGTNFTYSGWFSPDTLSSERIFVSNRFNSSTGWMIGMRGGNVLMDFGNQRAQATPTIPIEVGQNYFMAVRQDPNGDTNFGWAAGSNHRISLYDVTNDTWEHFDGTNQRNGLNLNEVSIGKFTNSGREWDGLVDDIRIYDNTLSQLDLNGLVVIPEPSSIALVSLAAIGLFVRRRLR